jgi:hypothetical protein
VTGRRNLKHAIIAICVIALRGTVSAQVYFPLHVGDSWEYFDCCSIECDGESFFDFIVGDTVIGGRTYLRFDHSSPFSGPFVRADSVRVFEYDTTDDTEYVVFDFQAKRGDTLSIRDHGNKIMIALGSLTFSEGTIMYKVRDSIGVVEIYSSGSLCDFKLRSARIGGKVLGIALNNPGVPKSPTLEQNYPNPFNPTTTISYGLSHRSRVALSVYDILGQLVATLVNEEVEAGYHDVRFDGTGLASGVYFYRLRAGDYVATKKLLLVR